jgi:NAD(P)-dependent dehydrogenase (short-subunit alcohol dehydrogenase family)
MAQWIWDDGGPLDGLVNNAAGNFISPTESLSSRGFDAIANIVLHGTFYVTHAVGKRWIASGHPGSVVSIVVTWIWTGSPYVVPSAMSKAGVHVMTQSLAVEWARYGIRLNAIAPGPFPTEGMGARLNPGQTVEERAASKNPMGRIGRMEEIQHLAVFLMADGCDWLTGQTIALDGAASLAGTGTFYDLRNWTDEDWQRARDMIKAQNERDKAQRSG